MEPDSPPEGDALKAINEMLREHFGPGTEWWRLNIEAMLDYQQQANEALMKAIDKAAEDADGRPPT